MPKYILIIQYLKDIAVGLLPVFLLSGTTRLWYSEGPVLFGGAKLPVLLLLCLTVIGLSVEKLKTGKVHFNPLRSFYSFLTLVFISDWLCRDYSLLQGPAIRGEIIWIGLVLFFLSRETLKKAILYYPAICLGVFFITLLIQTQGKMIVSDDHSTFLFRMKLLKSEFPKIPFYLPFWNLGWDARDFFATGALNFFLLFSPLIYIFDPENIHTILLGLLIFGVAPLASFYACRILHYNNRVGSIAALLSSCTSLVWYRWALKYGTLGFITSASLLPLATALSIKALTENKDLCVRQATLLCIVTSLILCWTPAGLVFIPLFIFALPKCLILLRRRNLMLAAIMIALINLPWIALFWNVSKVGSFLNKESPTEIVSEKVIKPESRFRHKTKKISLDSSLEVARTTARHANPLVLAGALFGIACLRRKQKPIYLGIILWLTLLGCFGTHIKPQLEFDRMLQILLQLACLPTAIALNKSLRFLQRGVKKPALCLALSILIVTPVSITQLLLNRSIIQYSIKDSSWDEVEFIIEQFSKGGRVLFTGCVVHQFNDSHLAPLAVNTQTPLIASSHVHNLWWYKDAVPADIVAGGTNAIESYFDLLNTTLVVAHEKKWINYFKSSNRYKEKGKVRGFFFFERQEVDLNYFFRGSGTILDQNNSQVSVSLDSPEAILKFRYFNFLEAKGCKISPYYYSSDLQLVKLSDCPVKQTINLHAGSPLKRLFPL